MIWHARITLRLNMHISHGTLNSMDSQTELRTLDEYDLVRFQKEHPADRHKSPSWYKTRIDRADLKQLMQRRDLPALRDTVL